MLPMSLTLDQLNTYRKLLVYSNSVNTDISSHLPTLYAHTVLQNPQLIVELGVRGGESTRAFIDVGCRLIGVDINNCDYPVNDKRKFYKIDDITFAQSHQPYLKNSINILFIDTSHLYKHTLDEITSFLPLMADQSLMIFHDTYMSPLKGFRYHRLNGVMGGGGWNNDKGVYRAICEKFSINFPDDKYVNIVRPDIDLIHYPFCNGLTIIRLKKLINEKI